MIKKIRKHLLLLCLVFIAGLFVLSPHQAQAAPVRGIDVSSWQGNIDWNAVRGSGVTFAMVRLGNTAYGVDEKAIVNAHMAAAAGLRVGAYVYTYASTVEEAMADAAFAIGLLGNLPISFPVAVDIEAEVHRRMDPASLTAIANVFCSMLYQAGYTPMVYSSKNMLTDKLHAVPWDVWVAQYADACDYAYPYVMWQGSCTGRVPGIAGDVDIDWLFKDYFTLIPAEGLINENGRTYGYKNFRRQFGFQVIGGVVFFFDQTGAMVRNQTITDEAGNITRICRDGHVVQITAKMQQDAAAAQALYLQAKAQTEGTQAALAQYQAAYIQAQTDYEAWMAQVPVLEAQAQAAAQAAALLPTPENLQAKAAADLVLEQARGALNLAYAASLQGARDYETASQALLIAQTAEAQAKQTADAALALIRIPD